MIKIENQASLSWYTSDLRRAVDSLSQADKDKFYQAVGESERDLRTYFECLLEDRQDAIIEFINDQITDAINQTIESI